MKRISLVIEADLLPFESYETLLENTKQVLESYTEYVDRVVTITIRDVKSITTLRKDYDHNANI